MGCRKLLATGLLLALLGVTFILRFHFLEQDLEYDITTYSGALITDEGAYNKCARSLALWGELRHPMDRNVYVFTPLYTLVMAAAFEILGVSLETTRVVSIGSFVVSLGCFFFICRTRWSVNASLFASLAISSTLHVVTFSRLGIVEPVGVAFSLAALLLWVRGRGRALHCVASMTLAACAFFTKIAFMFTLGAVALLWALDVWAAVRDRSWRQVVRLGLGIALVLGVTGLAFLGLERFAGRDWAEMQELAVSEQTRTLGLRTVMFELESIREFLLLERGRVALLAASLLMGPALWHRRTAVAARSRTEDRAYLAMALWAATGFVMFSMFEYRVPRYYYFLIYPLFYLAMEGPAAFFAPRHRRAALLGLVAVHLAVQMPIYKTWLAREPDATQADMARSVARRVTNGDYPPVLLGLQAPFVALFDERIRPLEFQFVKPETLCRRIDWWRPPYLVHYESQIVGFESRCPGVVAGLEPLAYYWVMHGFYYDSGVILARILYEQDAPGEAVEPGTPQAAAQSP